MFPTERLPARVLARCGCSHTTCPLVRPRDSIINLFIFFLWLQFPACYHLPCRHMFRVFVLLNITELPATVVGGFWTCTRDGARRNLTAITLEEGPVASSVRQPGASRTAEERKQELYSRFRRIADSACRNDAE